MLYKELGGPPTSSKNNHQYSNALSKGKKNPNRERSMPPEQKKKTKQLPRVTRITRFGNFLRKRHKKNQSQDNYQKKTRTGTVNS
jgi:hypothetical protein